jgi:hypothetical protein
LQNVPISQNVLIHVDGTFYKAGTFWYQSSEKGLNQIIQTKILDYFKRTLLVGFLLSVKSPKSLAQCHLPMCHHLPPPVVVTKNSCLVTLNNIAGHMTTSNNAPTSVFAVNNSTTTPAPNSRSNASAPPTIGHPLIAHPLIALPTMAQKMMVQPGAASNSATIDDTTYDDATHCGTAYHGTT